MLATPSRWLRAIFQSGSARVIVDVSTSPATFFAAMAPPAAENVPMLVPMSQTGTSACFFRWAATASMSRACAGLMRKTAFIPLLVIGGSVDDRDHQSPRGEHVAGAHQKVRGAPLHRRRAGQPQRSVAAREQDHRGDGLLRRGDEDESLLDAARGLDGNEIGRRRVRGAGRGHQKGAGNQSRTQPWTTYRPTPPPRG